MTHNTWRICTSACYIDTRHKAEAWICCPANKHDSVENRACMAAFQSSTRLGDRRSTSKTIRVDAPATPRNTKMLMMPPTRCCTLQQHTPVITDILMLMAIHHHCKVQPARMRCWPWSMVLMLAMLQHSRTGQHSMPPLARFTVDYKSKRIWH